MGASKTTEILVLGYTVLNANFWIRFPNIYSTSVITVSEDCFLIVYGEISVGSIGFEPNHVHTEGLLNLVVPRLTFNSMR